MKNEIELLYKNKEPEETVLKMNQYYFLKVMKHYGNVRIDRWSNMLIFGDNLIALNILYKNPSIKGNVKLIYIDPPFSTNQIYKLNKDRTATVSKSNDDSTAYKDILNGSDYLEFIRKRLIFLRELLSSDGSIYVHIDVKMGHYLKILMDEIFGKGKFINDITRTKCNPKNFSRKAFGNIKDMILFYSKTKKYIWNEPREELKEDDIKRLFSKIEKNGNRYATTPLHAPGETQNGPTGKPWRNITPPKGRHWRYSPEELEKLDKKGLIEWSSTGNPRKIIYADETIMKGKKRQDIWEFKDPSYPKYPTEKNLKMIKMILETSSNHDDIVLDCFAGSGTTLVAAEITGRKWIGIDNSELSIDIAKEKLMSIDNYSDFCHYEIYKNNS